MTVNEYVRSRRHHVRSVTRYFAFAADGLVRGKWSLEDAYMLFGPDVARHYNSILWLSHRRIASAGGGLSWRNEIDQFTEFNFYDEQDGVVALAFLLRATQCNRADTYPHLIIECAKELINGGYEEARAALTRYSRKRRRAGWPRRRLVRVLRRARYPRPEVLFTYGLHPIISAEEMKLVRRPICRRRRRRLIRKLMMNAFVE